MYPLGYPMEFASSSQVAVDAAQARWGPWPQLFEGPPLEIAIDVQEGPEAASPPSYQGDKGEVLFYCDPSNLASFSAPAMRGLLRVSPRTIAKHRWFEYHFFDALVLTALDLVYFQPLHAACVLSGDRGLILCGESGAGKTTLAYAAAQAGWTLVSEDGLHLAPDTAASVVGGYWVFRLRQAARDLFPELNHLPLLETGNGKMAMEVDAVAAGMKTAWSAQAGPAVFLSRRPGPAALRPFDPDLALAYYLRVPEQMIREGSEQRLREIVARGCHLLEYERPEDALALLEGLA